MKKFIIFNLATVATAAVMIFGAHAYADSAPVFDGSRLDLGGNAAIYASCVDHFSEDSVVRAALELQVLSGMPLFGSAEAELAKTGAKNYFAWFCAQFDCSDVAQQIGLCAGVMGANGWLF